MPHTRRRFLALAAALAAVAAPRAPRAAARQDADAIVIGAGAAGLAAARRLRAAGLRTVVLEARDRAGGRVWTDRSLGLPLDLGASWIHGTRENPVATIAREGRIATTPTDYESIWRYEADGAELPGRAEQAMERAFAALLETVGAARRRPDAPLQAAIERARAAGRETAADRRRLDYMVVSTIEHEYAADAAELSLLHWDHGDALDGADVIFPGGYDQMVRRLAEGLEVRTRHAVSNVAYDVSGVTVTTSQGALRAPLAIVTLPLGVLKGGAVTFDPPLPQRKRQAIARLGMGTLNKVYLRFPRVFWPREPHLIGYIAERRGAWAEWLNLAALLDEPVLLGFNAAAFGRGLERLTDREIVRQALAPLRAMFGAAAPDPTGAVVTRWASDPHALGSYSFLAVGATPEDRAALAAPAGERLLFAGEATHPAFPATVHGALLSGEAAAAAALGR